MARVTIQDALDYCLGNPDGLSVEQLLAKFPEYRDELQPMLVLSANIVTLEPPPVPIERRMAMKQRLMTAASATVTTVSVPQRHVVVQAPAPSPWWESLAALVRRPAMAGALGAFAVVALLWWSAAGSLPDSPLYGLKLTSEDLLRSFSSGTSGRIESYLNSAGARLGDIREMQRRDRLAQASPAIDNYRSNIVNSASLWEQTNGEERTNIAKKLYVSSARGVVGFGAIAPDLSNIADAVRANIGETIDALEKLRADTGGILISSNIDVNALLLDADIEPSTVPTPLPKYAMGTATASLPVAAGATQTSIAARATETSLSSAAQLTAVVIIAANGEPSAGISAARLNAAQTVVAGGTGSGMASARQTVLAPAATETPALRPTSTLLARPTGTSAVPTRTFSPVPPGPTRTVQPPTARPATNTPRPPQATATRRATNTRVVGLPTSIPVVWTPVLRTVVPTSTRLPSTVQPASSVTSGPVATPVPTNTPILLSTLVPLPTLTIELPLPPTQAPNTPRPTDTPVLPLPSSIPFTPPPLPTITLIQPPPTQAATSTRPPNTPTPLPLPTEIVCALELGDVDVSCGPGFCLNASGLVHNESASSVTATWTAELRVKVGSQGFITLSTQTGSREFAPGDTLLEPSFCLPLPVGTTRVQIRLSLTYGGCSDQQSSGAMQPCLLP